MIGGFRHKRRVLKLVPSVSMPRYHFLIMSYLRDIDEKKLKGERKKYIKKRKIRRN